MTSEQTRSHRWHQATEWPLTASAAVFLVAYSVQALAHPAAGLDRLLEIVIWLTWAIFAIDYVVRIWLAERRIHWVATHPLDLLVVALPMFRPLRTIRLVTLLTVFERAAGRRFRGRVIVYAGVGSLMVTYIGALGELVAERDAPTATITSFGEAIWWAFTTITTVGYGDRYPVTSQGRLIAVGLMVGGIALLGMVTATLASWLVQRVAESDAAQEAATRAQVERLEERIDELTGAIRALTGSVATATGAPTESPHA